MKKYTYKETSHCFEDGIYIGFEDGDKPVNSEYSPMVKQWVNEKKSEDDLKEPLVEAGFYPTQ